MNASASASVVVSVNDVNVNGYGYAREYGENDHGQRGSVGVDASHVFQFARSSARQLLREPGGQHPLQGHTLAMTLPGEVAYAHDAAAADMHDAVAMVAAAADMYDAGAMVAVASRVGASPSTPRSALFEWA